MTSKPILYETFCIYCQREYANPANLQRHVIRYHANTYASVAITKAKKKASHTGRSQGDENDE